MTPANKPEFLAVLSRTFRTLRQPVPEPEILNVWWTKLEPHPLEAVAQAFSKHLDVSEFAPTPAAILKHLPKESDGHPDANEAWAISLRGRDERETVVWTQECAQAFGVASPVLEEGDETGARMAFKAAYERLVEKARGEGRKAQWIKSLGHDPDLREAALVDAVRAGRLQIEEVRPLVPALQGPRNSYDEGIAQQNLARLRQLTASINNRGEVRD
jgi:hypothetical protein